MQLIYEKSVSGRRGVMLPVSDVPAAADLPQNLLRSETAALPELSELDMVRHFTNLSRRNFSVDTNFYPLGSCTMKYNAKVLENAANLFAPLHPLTAFLPGGAELCQGALGMLYDLGQMLADITGMDEVTTQPLAAWPCGCPLRCSVSRIFSTTPSARASNMRSEVPEQMTK